MAQVIIMFDKLRGMFSREKIDTFDRDCDCCGHHFGDWEVSEATWTDNPHNGLKRSYSYEMQKLSVKYDRKGDKVDKRDPELVPYEEVATIWARLSGCSYHVMVVKHKEIRRCMASNCRETEVRYVPIRYVAFHGDSIVADTSTWDGLETELIRHSAEVCP